MTTMSMWAMPVLSYFAQPFDTVALLTFLQVQSKELNGCMHISVFE